MANQESKNTFVENVTSMAAFREVGKREEFKVKLGGFYDSFVDAGQGPRNMQWERFTAALAADIASEADLTPAGGFARTGAGQTPIRSAVEWLYEEALKVAALKDFSTSRVGGGRAGGGNTLGR